MRRLIPILLLCTSLPVLAQNQPVAYFCTTPGSTLRYERFDDEGSKHWWTHTSAVNSANLRNDGVMEVIFTSSIKPDKEKSPVKAPVTSTALLYPDGTTVINISDAAASIARHMFSALNFQVSGGISSLPATIKPGDALEDIHGTIEWNGIKITLDYTDRKVLRRETITVPAGTFDCMVVREHKVDKRPLNKRDRITYTWYAPGYGMIRHDSHFPDGRRECSEQLYSVSR